MTKDQIPIHHLPQPKSPIAVNISYGGDGITVPEFECREAAVYGHYNWTEWAELDHLDRAGAVAQYRLHHMIESHVQDESRKDSERKSRKNSGGGVQQPRAGARRRSA